jgi:hypothetical protein
MTNLPTWTYQGLTIYTLPCGTLQYEYEWDGEIQSFDRVEKIYVIEGAHLELDSGDMIHSFPEMGEAFLADAPFPVSDIPTPPSYETITGVWDENGKPISLLTLEDGVVFHTTTTAAGDSIRTRVTK